MLIKKNINQFGNGIKKKIFKNFKNFKNLKKNNL